MSAAACICRHTAISGARINAKIYPHAQAEQEEKAGLPVSVLPNREKSQVAQSQVRHRFALMLLVGDLIINRAATSIRTTSVLAPFSRAPTYLSLIRTLSPTST